MQKIFLKHQKKLLFGCITTLMFILSCSKLDNSSSGTENQLNTNSYLSFRNDIPFFENDLDRQAYNEIISDDYDNYGKWVFDHHFRNSDKEVESYVPSDMLSEVVSEMENLSQYDNETYEQAKSRLLNQNDAETTADVNLYDQFRTDLKATQFSTFGETWFWFRAYEQTLLNNQSLGDEKYPVLIACSILRYHAKLIFNEVQSEKIITWGVSEREGEDPCIFGIKWNCWVDALLDAGIFITDILIIKASIVAAPATGGGSLLIAAFTSVKGIASFLKFLKSTFKLFGSSCDCSDSSSPPECEFTITDVQMLVPKDSCHNRQIIRAVGGDLNKPFIFILNNAKPAYQPISPDNRYFSPIPFFQITPLDITQPSTVGVFQLCGGTERGIVKTFSANFYHEVFTSGSVIMYGWTTSNVGATNYYDFLGTWQLNENNTLTAGVSQHGQILSQIGNKVAIKWISSSGGSGTPWSSGQAQVTGQIANSCSSPPITSWTSLFVTVN